MNIISQQTFDLLCIFDKPLTILRTIQSINNLIPDVSFVQLMLIFSVQSGAAITRVMDFSRLLALNAIEGSTGYRSRPHWTSVAFAY
jgi:hypothetical protein